MKKALAATGAALALCAGLAAPAAAQQEDHYPYREWHPVTAVSLGDPGFFNFNQGDIRIISHKGAANVQCYTGRGYIQGCRQDGRELPQLMSNGWMGVYINMPELEPILLPLRPVLEMVFISSTSS